MSRRSSGMVRPLLDGSSWFLESFNKVWKRMLLQHTNNGRGRQQAEPHQHAEQTTLPPSQQHAQTARAVDEWNSQDRQAMRDMCMLTDPAIAAVAAERSQPISVQAALLTAAGRATAPAQTPDLSNAVV
jgi:hypothetical protein